MLSQYIQKSMMKAHYELLENGEGYYGEIPGFQGVWASADTLEECRNELQEVLEEWIVLKLRKYQFVPKLESYNLEGLLCES